MFNATDILETIRMIDQENLDVRTITMGISLLSCADADIARACTKVYDKITRLAERLVPVGEEMGMQIRAQREEVFDAMYKI
jgi:uncharacterized protein (UPF0210 family)